MSSSTLKLLGWMEPRFAGMMCRISSIKFVFSFWSVKKIWLQQAFLFLIGQFKKKKKHIKTSEATLQVGTKVYRYEVWKFSTNNFNFVWFDKTMAATGNYCFSLASMQKSLPLWNYCANWIQTLQELCYESPLQIYLILWQCGIKLGRHRQLLLLDIFRGVWPPGSQVLKP